MEVTERLELSDYEGDGRLTITTETTGGAAERLRNFFAGNSREQISANYLEFQAANYPEIAMEEMVVFEDVPEKNRFRIVESYRLPKPWSQNREKNRLFDYYPREVASWLPSEPSGSRTRPMEIAHPLENRLVSYLELPEKWGISGKPFRITNPFFEFSESASWKGNTLRVEHRYRSNDLDSLPAPFQESEGNLPQITIPPFGAGD